MDSVQEKNRKEQKDNNYVEFSRGSSELQQRALLVLYGQIIHSQAANELHHKLLDLRQSFAEITEREPFLQRLVFVTLLFSMEMIIAEDQVRLNDSLAA